MISIPMMIFFMIESKNSILLLSGSQYINAVVPMIILMPIMVISSLSNITVMQILIPNNKENEFMKSVMLGAGLNLILNVLLISYIGTIVAVISTLIAEFVQFIMQLIYTKKYIKEIFLLKQLIKVRVTSITSGIILIIFKNSIVLNFSNIEISCLISIILNGFLFFMSYIFILNILKFDLIIEIKRSLFIIIKNNLEIMILK